MSEKSKGEKAVSEVEPVGRRGFVGQAAGAVFGAGLVAACGAGG